MAHRFQIGDFIRLQRMSAADVERTGAPNSRYSIDPAEFSSGREFKIIELTGGNGVRDKYIVNKTADSRDVWFVLECMAVSARQNFLGGVRYRVQMGARSFEQLFDPALSPEQLVEAALGDKPVLFTAFRDSLLAGTPKKDNFTLMRMD